MAGFLDAVQFLANSAGIVDFVVNSAVVGFQTPAQAGAADGTTYHYRAQSFDLSQWEVGLGTYSVATTTLARTTVLFSSAAGAKVGFTAAPNVGIVIAAEDLTNIITQSVSSSGGDLILSNNFHVSPSFLTFGGVNNQLGYQFEIHVVSNARAGLAAWSNDASITQFNFLKSRGNNVSIAGVLLTGDTIGAITFRGSDGTSNIIQCAGINGVVDASPLAGFIPGRLVFTTTSTVSQQVERMRIDSNGLVSFTSSFGYGLPGVGTGGTIGQTTSKSTGVTLNTSTGQITLNNASLNANTTVTFTLTNSQIGANDLIVLQHTSVGTQGAYAFDAFPSPGSAVIAVRNNTAGALAEAIVVTFFVLKCVIT